MHPNCMTSFLLLIITFGCTIFYSESATEGEFLHPLTNIPSPSYQIETSSYFPNENQRDHKLPVGKSVTILCHVTNSGPSAYNVTAIMGSLNHVYDFRHYIQNYTYQPYGMVIKAGEELTLQYTFQIHPELEATEYVLAHTVFYENDKNAYASTFFNQTVLLYFPNTEYDLESTIQVLFSVLCTLCVLVGAFFACAPESTTEQVLLSKSSGGSTGRQKKTFTSDDNDSWTNDGNGGAQKKKSPRLPR